MLMPFTMALALLPAWSVAVPLTLWFAPLLDSVTSLGQVSMPERVSVRVTITVPWPLSQPFALGLVVGAPLIVGLIWSILIPLTVPLALLPALSVVVPTTDWF